MRRRETFAWMSARAARSTMRSWNEKRYSRRGPRVGVTKPTSMRPRMVLRDSRRTRSTSRTLYVCIGWPGTVSVALALRAVFAGCSTRFASLRGPSLAADAFADSVRSRLARSASIRSITLPVLSGSISATEISCPSTFFWIAAWMRPRCSSVYAAGSKLSDVCCSMSCLRELQLRVLHLGLRHLDLARSGARPRRSAAAASSARRPTGRIMHDVRLAARRPAADRAAASPPSAPRSSSA